MPQKTARLEFSVNWGALGRYRASAQIGSAVAQLPLSGHPWRRAALFDRLSCAVRPKQLLADVRFG
jgi:hypothetical protein